VKLARMNAQIALQVHLPTVLLPRFVIHVPREDINHCQEKAFVLFVPLANTPPSEAKSARAMIARKELGVHLHTPPCVWRVRMVCTKTPWVRHRVWLVP
jgi:hypothetical protein